MESKLPLCKIVEKEDREPTNSDDDIDEKNVELFDSFDIGAKYLGFSSSRSLKTREKYTEQN